jgi:hypothetical protein
MASELKENTPLQQRQQQQHHAVVRKAHGEAAVRVAVPPMVTWVVHGPAMPECVAGIATHKSSARANIAVNRLAATPREGSPIDIASSLCLVLLESCGDVGVPPSRTADSWRVLRPPFAGNSVVARFFSFLNSPISSPPYHAA